MAVEIKTLDKGVTQLVLRGAIGVSAATEIEPKVRSVVSKGSPLIIDMAGVSFVSSQGIRVIVAAAKDLSAKGYRTVIVRPKPEIRKVFRIMNIELIIPVLEDGDDGVAAVLAS